jgi:hypothetical protein
MSNVRLVVRRLDEKTVLVLRVIPSDSGPKIYVDEVSSAMSADVARWLERGLFELVGERGARRPRVTTKDDPNFLDRLKTYLADMGFSVAFEPAVDVFINVRPPEQRPSEKFVANLRARVPMTLIQVDGLRHSNPEDGHD